MSISLTVWVLSMDIILNTFVIKSIYNMHLNDAAMLLIFLLLTLDGNENLASSEISHLILYRLDWKIILD